MIVTDFTDETWNAFLAWATSVPFVIDMGDEKNWRPWADCFLAGIKAGDGNTETPGIVCTTVDPCTLYMESEGTCYGV